MQQVIFIVLSLSTLGCGHHGGYIAQPFSQRSLAHPYLRRHRGAVHLTPSRVSRSCPGADIYGRDRTLIIFAIMLSRSLMDPDGRGSTTNGGSWLASAPCCS